MITTSHQSRFEPSRGCGSAVHFSRRSLLQGIGLGTVSWLTPLSQALARRAELLPSGQPAKSVIVLWMEGGPSQLETFDPHPGTSIAGGSKAIDTSLQGVQIGEGLPLTAEWMHKIAIVRSMVCKELSHDRAIYNIKTGYRPDPTLIHPAIGSIICHETAEVDRKTVDIPRHISILPGELSSYSSVGGYLGTQFDAFKTGDPRNPVPDLIKSVSDERYRRRMSDLENVVEREFARGRLQKLEVGATANKKLSDAAFRMMDSQQTKAFDLSDVPESTKDAFGDTEFGRGCLAAVRLIEAGVRCVEVTLKGWDSHSNNHEQHARLLKTLDPAYVALLGELERRELLDETLVICGGEFGRTPNIKADGGRDHWPFGFSVALAGGGIAGGRVIGKTSPTPRTNVAEVYKDKYADLVDPRPVEDLHATVLHAMGIDFAQEVMTPIGRPMKLSSGQVIKELLVEG